MHQITDTFVSGGAIGGRQNIAPSEAAELMGNHHKIIDASEVALPDEEMGERVCACILCVTWTVVCLKAA